MVLEARYGTLVTRAVFHNLSVFDPDEPEAGGQGSHGPLEERGDAVSRELLAQRTNEFVNGLASYGIPVRKLELSSHGAVIADDRAAYSKLGISAPVTDSYTESRKGEFISKGWHWTHFENAWMGPFLHSDVDAIVLHPEIADLVGESLNNLLGDTGPTNPAGYVLLSKLIQAAVHHAGFDDAMPEGALKRIAEKLTKEVIPAMKQLHDVMQKPFEEWQQIDINRLRNTVAIIRDGLGHGGYDSMRDQWGDFVVDWVLEALGWEDEDRDGLPDWLEDWLRNHGLDPDDLPETPEDLPGRASPTPLWVPPGHLHPVFLPVPISVPVDPG